MQNLQYTDEHKTTIRAELDGETLFIPVSPGNRHYDQIVAENLTVADHDA